jgi:hypothetical protein
MGAGVVASSPAFWARYVIAALSVVCAGVLAFGLPERLRQRKQSGN